MASIQLPAEELPLEEDLDLLVVGDVQVEGERHPLCYNLTVLLGWAHDHS